MKVEFEVPESLWCLVPAAALYALVGLRAFRSLLARLPSPTPKAEDFKWALSVFLLALLPVWPAVCLLAWALRTIRGG